MPLSRRRFLTATGLACATLAICGGAWRLTRHPAPAAFVLTDDARGILHAIVPALLAGALHDPAAIAPTVARVNRTILGLPLTAQQEVQGLFRLLALGPVRRLLAGVPASWADATPEQVSVFLQSWRTHRFADLQAAYAALHDLVLGAWYAEPSSWQAAGYPGPLPALSA